MFTDVLQAPEYEEALLGATIKSEFARETTRNISAQDFANPSNAAIWTAIQELHGRGEAVDVLTVSECMTRHETLGKNGNGAAYLEALVANHRINGDSAKTYADRVYQASLARQVVGVGAACGELANRALGMTQEELRSEYNRIMQNGLPPANNSLLQRVDVGIDQLFAFLKEPRDMGVPMRIKSPNIAAAGGMAAMLYPGMVSTVVGASGDGKTAWLSEVAENAAIDGATVAIVDGEIPPELANARRMQRYSGVPADRQIEQTYDKKPILNEQEWLQLTNARESMDWWTPNIHYLYAPGMSMWTVLDQLRELQRQQPLGLVILDYIQLFTADDNQRNEAQAISWAVQSFKNFCGQSGAHGYMGSQFNNEAVKGFGPRTQYGAKGSGDIGAKSNLVLTIQRPLNNDATKIKRTLPGGIDVFVEPGEADIEAIFRVDKNSFGKSGKIAKMIFHGPYYRWMDLTNDDAPTGA